MRKIQCFHTPGLSVSVTQSMKALHTGADLHSPTNLFFFFYLAFKLTLPSRFNILGNNLLPC